VPATEDPAKRTALTVLLSIVSSLLVGLVLAVAPWTSLWESNWLLQPWPALRPLLLSGFARGAVTGIGLVNVLVALADLHARRPGAARRR
jgi:hypothetical protein